MTTREGAAPNVSIVPARASADERLQTIHWRLLICLGNTPEPARYIDLRGPLLVATFGAEALAAHKALNDLHAWGYVAPAGEAMGEIKVLYEVAS